MFQPLAGIRVLDMSHVIAGPLASFYLAQMGAEVLKIENAEHGDIMRSGRDRSQGDTPDAFVSLNAGKHSITPDIRTAAGVAHIHELVTSCDVFIENFRPGVVARRGLDYEALRKIKPDLIYCSISGYGQQGEWSTRGGYDHVMQAVTGMMMMSGEAADPRPVKVGFPVIDVAVGMLGALSISAALHGRTATGKGQYIDCSMVQASLMLMYPHATGYLCGGPPPERMGNRGYSGSPTADTYQCADGWIATGANTAAQFRTLTALLGLVQLCDDERALDLDLFRAEEGFVVARDINYLSAQLRDAFAKRSAHEMERLLNEKGVPAARVRSLDQFLDEMRSGHQVKLPMMRYLQDGREVITPGLGFQFADDAAAAPRAGAEALGASNPVSSIRASHRARAIQGQAGPGAGAGANIGRGRFTSPKRI